MRFSPRQAPRRMRDRKPKASALPIPWQLVRRTILLLGAHRAPLFLAVASTTAAAVLWFAGPYFLRHLTDTAIAGDFGLFGWLIVASLLVALVSSAVTYARRLSVATLGALVVRDLRNRLTSHIQKLPMPAFERYHSGDLVSRLNNDLESTMALLRRAPELVYQPLQLIGGLAFMLAISPKLTLVVCASMPISVVIYERVVRPMQRHSGKKMVALAGANEELQDVIRGASIVRAFGLQNLLERRFERTARDVEQHDMSNQIRNILSFIPFLTLRYVPQLLVPIYGGLLAFRGEITVGDLLAVNWLIWPVFLPLEALLATIRELRETAPALERTYEVLDTQPERTMGSPITPISQVPPVSFRSVSFAYGDSAPVLSGLSFEVSQGATVALVGASGCGKSTILKLLCGFLEPDQGDICVFGSPLAEAHLGSLRKAVSWMSQDPFLFPTTIEQNIAYGRLGASRNEIVAAAKAANAHGFITALPLGYETSVGELGNRLSGGQKQRICLARLILEDAPILLLDEPTAALDTESETVVLEALDRTMKHKTTLIVSHRLSSLRGVDEILVIDGGRLRARGTHRSLLETDALYRLYVERQTCDNSVAGGNS